MRMVDIIWKKRQGGALQAEEIARWVKGILTDAVPDYQSAALLMAICINGMDERETADLTRELAASGNTLDLSELPGVKVDKHSTGGVGDKTTLVVSPLVASLGVPVVKMSGRGLGHTGGTLDKLSAIFGLRSDFSEREMLDIVKKCGMVFGGHSKNLTPADKKLYALRDVTGTVDSLPLIAASVMSKKIACGADKILLDVKAGSGAFFKDIEMAKGLASLMVSIGENAGRPTVALLTEMDEPLGCAVGNALEVAEALETLRGKGPSDFVELCVALSAQMLYLAGRGSLFYCEELARQALQSGAAFAKFQEAVALQGGDLSLFEDQQKYMQDKRMVKEFLAPKSGYIAKVDARKCGLLAMALGAGRETQDSEIDLYAGVVLHKKVGEYVEKGERIATLYSQEAEKLDKGGELLAQAVEISHEVPSKKSKILARITADGIENFYE